MKLYLKLMLVFPVLFTINAKADILTTNLSQVGSISTNDAFVYTSQAAQSWPLCAQYPTKISWDKLTVAGQQMLANALSAFALSKTVSITYSNVSCGYGGNWLLAEQIAIVN